jgi:hypothetical protein
MPSDVCRNEVRYAECRYAECRGAASGGGWTQTRGLGMMRRVFYHCAPAAGHNQTTRTWRLIVLSFPFLLHKNFICAGQNLCVCISVMILYVSND